MKKPETDAQERIEVTVCENGVVNVHRPESDRAHSVFVDDSGGVVRCSCKGHRFHGHCVHQDAVDGRSIVTSVAAAAESTYSPTAVTDGGEVEEDSDDDNDRFEVPDGPDIVDSSEGKSTTGSDSGNQSHDIDDDGDDWTYIADCQSCGFCEPFDSSIKAHEAEDRHEDHADGRHVVTVRVDEGEDIHCGVI